MREGAQQLVKASTEKNSLKWLGFWRSSERRDALLRVTRQVRASLITPSEDSCNVLDSSGSSSRVDVILGGTDFVLKWSLWLWLA